MDKKPLIKKILLSFEQSSTTIKYDKVYIYADGKNDTRQITLSFGITEQGNLKKLIESYISLGGRNKSKFESYISKVGKEPLVDNKDFINLLTESGSDPVMQMCQDKAFDDMYITPAYGFCSSNKLETHLSKLVISDSYLHSGTILGFLRNKFSEKVPVNGGDEKKWIQSYCEVRKDWLANHTRQALRNTVYRMNFMLDRIKKGDWDLTQSPFNANGVIVNP